MSGPVGKRSEERVRRNKPVIETTKVDLSVTTTGFEIDMPDPNPEWHEVAHLWYVSLCESGQARFYEPSDWATAYIIAEELSREMSPKPLEVEELNVATGEMERFHRMVTLPMIGGKLTAILRGMTSLMVTEGDRRRLQMELSRQPKPGEGQATNVTSITKNRQEALGG